MPVPATTGQLKTKVSDMGIGDYIVCAFSCNPYIELNRLGDMDSILSSTDFKNELPLNGGVYGEASQRGFFYFVKVAKGLLVADRVCQLSVSWKSLNNNKLIQGMPFQTGIIRSITGGVAFADKDNNQSLTDQGYGGWPTNNEWDRYVVGFPLERISSGKTNDDVFHHMQSATNTTDTLIKDIMPSYTRIVIRRSNKLQHSDADAAYQAEGFRPVFEYQES